MIKYCDTILLIFFCKQKQKKLKLGRPDLPKQVFSFLLATYFGLLFEKLTC